MENSPLLAAVPTSVHKPIQYQEAITEFFRWYDLPDAKQILWNMAKTALCSDDYDDSKARMQLIWMVEHLIALMESLHEYHESNKKSSSVSVNDSLH